MPGKVGFLIKGDSKLTIDFCLRRARPGKAVLFRTLRRVQAMVAPVRRFVVFAHVPRERNQVADWLANVARAASGTVDAIPLCTGLREGGPLPCLPADAARVLGTDVKGWLLGVVGDVG